MATIIRWAAPSDREEIFPLVEEFATSFKPEKAVFDHSFGRLIDDDSACVLVAETVKRVIGYCLGFNHYTFYANGRVAWVEEIMVDQDHRHQNVGRRLMNQFEAWSRSRKATLVGLATRRAAPYQALNYQNSAVYFRKLL